jgi:hypothetical protein
MTNEPDEASQDHESPATLTDKDGQHLASVTASFSQKQRFGDFRLPSSIDVRWILAKATSLQTSDGKRFQLLNLRLCIAYHLENPDQPHMEFDYEPD